ncbi:hypothetical protein ZIOFF_030789 [Zingiber officinale]|nr:hypothetical protein ZIOFF_030789 [Zingiber officinale]
MKTIVEVVQLCHCHGVIHRDLEPENFLFSNKKENSPLKAIDFGLSIFFQPADNAAPAEELQHREPTGGVRGRRSCAFGHGAV